MKIKPTKTELQECIVNAVSRLIKEGKTMRDERAWGKKDDYKKRTPKHQKMKPQGKEKYKNWGESDF